MQTAVTVPPGEGHGILVPTGARFRLTTPKGAQCADFWAFNAANTAEYLSCPHTWVANFCVVPKEGQTFRTRFRRPILEFTKDGANGFHDMLITTCDQFRYEHLGYRGVHGSCADNLSYAARRLGFEPAIIPQAVNFFARSVVAEDGKLTSPVNTVAPGSYVELIALMDTYCVVSSCPFDLPVKNWDVSGAHEHGVTELEIEVF